MRENTLSLLISECTIRKCIVLGGGNSIIRRVAVSSHTQPSFYSEGGFVKHASTGCGGDRKARKSCAAHEGGGDVIGDHEPLGRVGEPGECHGAGDLRIRSPRGSPIRRGRESHIQLAG